MIEFIRRDLLGKVGRHGGKLRLSPRFDLLLGELNLLAQLIHYNENRSLFFDYYPGYGSAVFQFDHLASECVLDIPVGVEHIFNQPLQTAAADAVQLRADCFSFSADLVAFDAVLLEYVGAARDHGLVGMEGGEDVADRSALPVKPPPVPGLE